VVEGGTITALAMTMAGNPVIVVRGAIDVATMGAAADADFSRADPAALERLFGSFDYDYRGKNNPDRFPPGAGFEPGIPFVPAGNDLFRLAGGDDMLGAGSGDDSVAGGAGNDMLWGEAGDDRLFGGAGNDWLFDWRGTDRLFGGAGHDTLLGGGDNIRLSGGTGHDWLDGSAGNDVLSGGAGADTFVLVGGGGRDRVTDFEDGVDVVGVAAGARFTGDRFRGGEGDVRFIVSGSDGLVQIDSDGDRRADATLVLAGVTTFDAGDILFA
jgi:Ca2+-binding RTX toxin-like protein